MLTLLCAYVSDAGLAVIGSSPISNAKNTETTTGRVARRIVRLPSKRNSPSTVYRDHGETPARRLAVIAFVAVAVWFLEPLAATLQYEPAAIASGQLWRIVTGHLTHWSLDHLFWDVLVFVVAGSICEQENRSRFLACLGLSALAIPLAVRIAWPDLATYRGLSGIDSALFTLLAVTALRDAVARKDRRWALVIGLVSIGFIGKTAYEFATGNTLFVDSTSAEMIPVAVAHVVGGLVGVTAAVWGSVPGTSRRRLSVAG